MARYDKYVPDLSGTRAPLNADWLDADLGKIVPVSLNASGKIVKGTAGQSSFIGVLCLTKKRYANDVVDVMQYGDIVEVTGTVAGQRYYAVADGSGISTTVLLNHFVGFTVEADRLVVRCGLGVGAVS
jgi:hypothetical protein